MTIHKKILFRFFNIPTFRNNYGCMKKFQLGEFEEIVLLTIAILQGQAYGVSIKNEIEERLSRSVSLGALHTAILRLEEKGYVRSRDGESSPERAGRPKRYVEITALGKKAMEYSKNSRDSLWKALPKNIMGIRKS